jgi:hypothetical protein
VDINRAIDYEHFKVEDGVIVPRLPYIVGLDLGQSVDPTALAILEKHGGEDDQAVFHCRHLARFALGTSYPSIVKEVIQLCETEPLRTGPTQLAIDQTGVGRPVVDLFLRASIRAEMHPITIHGGDLVTFEGGAARVPKRELVSVTQACLQTGRLKFAASLPELEVLKHELQNFQVKISESGFDSYNARSGAHDDLVLAVALALWLGARRGPRSQPYDPIIDEAISGRGIDPPDDIPGYGPAARR